MTLSGLSAGWVWLIGLWAWDGVSSAILAEQTVCEFYNQTCIDQMHALHAATPTQIPGSAPNISSCVGNQTCPSSKRHTCYAVWSHAPPASDEPASTPGPPTHHPTGHRVKMMGCFMSADTDCLAEDSCQDRTDLSDDAGHLFCCCRGSMCNSGFQWIRPLETAETAEAAPAAEPTPDWTVLAYVSVGVVVVIALAVLAILWVYRQRQAATYAASTSSPADPRQRHDAPTSPQLIQQEVEVGSESRDVEEWCF